MSYQADEQRIIVNEATHPQGAYDLQCSAWILPGPSLRPLAQVEDAYIKHVYLACGRSTAKAAEVLGIGRATLYRKLSHMEIPDETQRNPQSE